MTGIESFDERIRMADPTLLVGEDEYVLSCRDCPLNTPYFIAGQRQEALHDITREILSPETMNVEVQELIAQMGEWLVKAGMHKIVEEDIPPLVIVNVKGRWVLMLSRQVAQHMTDQGIAYDTYLTAFNDQYGAKLNVQINEATEHVNQSHPGKVVCGGMITREGKKLCGATIQTVPCEDHERKTGEDIIIASVKRTVERGR